MMNSAGSATPASPTPGMEPLHHSIAGLPPEEPVWAGRASPRSFVPQYLGWLAALIVVWALMSHAEHQKWLPLSWSHYGWAFLVMLVLLAALLAKQLIAYFSLRYRLTTQRLFIEKGIVDKITDQIELVRVDDVRVIERLIPRLLGVGDVALTTTDVNDRDPIIRNITTPHQVAEQIRTHVRTMRQVQRMVYMENVGQDVGADPTAMHSN